MASSDKRVPADVLRKFVEEILARLGFGSEDAAMAADVVLEADLRGVDSHGVRAFGSRAADMESGKLVAMARPELLHEFGAMALFDGHHGYGPILCASILDKAIELAGSHGLGMVSIKNSSHWGCPAYYSRAIARQGYVGIGMTNTNPAMPLWGSSAKSIGNNPLTIAVPRRGHEPIVLDLAMQQISWGGISLAKERGEKLPGLWGYDAAGNETDDPDEVTKSGRVRPMGDYKGSGLAVMLEVLTGVLSSGLVCYQLGERTKAGEPAHYSQAFLATKIDNFAPADRYFDQIDFLYDTAKGSPLAEDATEISLPGDRSNATLQERKEKGIPIGPIRASVKRLSRQYDLPVPWASA